MITNIKLALVQNKFTIAICERSRNVKVFGTATNSEHVYSVHVDLRTKIDDKWVLCKSARMPHRKNFLLRQIVRDISSELSSC